MYRQKLQGTRWKKSGGAGVKEIDWKKINWTGVALAVLEGEEPMASITFKRSRGDDSDDESTGCAPLTASSKRTRLDLDSEGSEVDDTEGSSSGDESDDDTTVPIIVVYKQTEKQAAYSGPSFTEWRSSSGSVPAPVTSASEPPSATTSRQKIEERKMKKLMALLCSLFKLKT